MLPQDKEYGELIELQKKLAVPIFSVDEIYERLEPEALRCLKPEVMLNYSCIPIGIGDPGSCIDALYIVVSAELTDQQKDELALISNKRILVSAVAQKKDIVEAINYLASRGVMEAAQIGAGGVGMLEKPKVPKMRFDGEKFVAVETADNSEFAGLKIECNLAALRLFSKALAREHRCIVVKADRQEKIIHYLKAAPEDSSHDDEAALGKIPGFAMIQEMGLADEKDIAAAIENWYGQLEAKEAELAALSKKFNVPIVDLNAVEIDPALANLYPLQMMKENLCLLLHHVDANRILVAMADPSNIYVIDDVKFSTGLYVDVNVALAEDIIAKCDSMFLPGKGLTFEEAVEGFSEDDDVEFGQEETDAVELERSVEDAPIVRLSNIIIIDAIRRKASHIHVEPYEKDFRVRLRIDGVLYEVMRPPMSLKNGIGARLKIMAELDIANRLTPQTGKIILRLGRGVERTLLVSTLPTPHGEKIVLKILHGKNDEKIHDLMHLGLEADQYELMQSAVKKPGLILIAGPHDSGKNTTMRMLVSELNRTTANIVVIGGNDWNISGINYTDSLDALNAAVHQQDSDVIVIGKLDERSLQIAMNAGAMGKKVIAGIDSYGDAAEVVSMLVNMGAPLYKVVNSVNSIVSQRLVRWLCDGCKKKAEEAEECDILKELGVNTDETVEMKYSIHLTGQGCRECSEVTFKGRTAIFEILRLTDEMREIIANGADAKEIRAQAKKEHMMTLYYAGCEKVFSGVASHKDILALDLVK